MTQEREPRRRFLQQVLAIVPASTLATGAAITQTGCTNDPTRGAAAAAANPAQPYTPTYFTEAEWKFIHASVDHLIPADEHGAGAVEAGVPEFIDRQLESPWGHGQLWYMQGPFHPDVAPELGYQINQTPRDVYRHGIAACDAWCMKQHGKTYADLDKTLQEQILKDLDSGKIVFDAVPSRTFFNFLLSNTKEGYLSDPIYGGNKHMAGWKMVGFPGARADFIDWADQPNAKYPYGPVSISGRKGLTMAIKRDKVDVVLVGFGWTGAILGQELTDAGLNVLALERGAMRDTPTDAQYPKVIDELAYSVRGKLYQELAKETVTIRHGINDLAVPYRQHGSFLLGNGVGGAGFHWNGMHYRALPEELQLRTRYEERYGKKFIPEGMTIQDFGVTYDELEPYFDQFEYVCGTSGKAGNLQGKIVPGGNPREGARSREYPVPPLQTTYGAELFDKAAREVGFNPYPAPAANASQPYTNPYGVRLGPCNFCGFCENFGCYMYSKASPQTTILPVLLKKPNFELRTHSQVLKVNLDSSGKKATGVTYIDAQGREIEQPADLVILTAYQMHNVRLLLLSGIGKPYDPVTGEGVVGKNYAYQMNGGVSVLLPKGTQLNPFVGTGAGGVSMDDLNGDQFDHGPLGFVGGASIRHIRTGGRPIGQAATVPGTPRWGSGWKAGVQDAYQRYLNIGISGSVMSYRDAYLSLDPTYKDIYGQPLLRMTFDWHDNEFDMLGYMGKRMDEVAKAMKPEKHFVAVRKKGSHYDTRLYQSTHNTGGAIMGTNPKESVVNKYLQSWDVPNVFVMGACLFPQNMGYNPTGLVAALAYWSVRHIREQYLKNPGPLVQA